MRRTQLLAGTAAPDGRLEEADGALDALALGLDALADAERVREGDDADVDAEAAGAPDVAEGALALPAASPELLVQPVSTSGTVTPRASTTRRR
ncbi:hypothetical protein HJ588_12165 [Flexivirga sp. ID2601S]|uniref:Uncharacterized protein n=1 Tax=Flexivirga aerilata TaxID=1656889 RepID=A0A849AI01_9MICO|nr:hypothetical protein [Flexivirga aerilata]NNG40019.1 hypothetical protein [Flexivirga aerilata]